MNYCKECDFANFAQNGDGFINRQELGYVMDNLGLQMDKDEIEVALRWKMTNPNDIPL